MDLKNTVHIVMQYLYKIFYAKYIISLPSKIFLKFKESSSTLSNLLSWSQIPQNPHLVFLII